MTNTAFVTKSDVFINVIFNGDNTSEINSDWIREKQKIIENYSNKEKLIEERIELCKTKLLEINKLNPWWKFWHSKNERKEIDKLKSSISSLELEKRVLPKHKNDDVYIKLCEFLVMKGYALTNTKIGFYDSVETWTKYD